MADGTYTTTYDVKVTFTISDLYSRKIITHRLHIDKTRGNEGIACVMIIGHDLMVKLGLKTDFGRQVLEWDKTVVPIKEPYNLLDQPDSTKRNMRDVVMQTTLIRYQ